MTMKKLVYTTTFDIKTSYFRESKLGYLVSSFRPISFYKINEIVTNEEKHVFEITKTTRITTKPQQKRFQLKHLNKMIVKVIKAPTIYNERRNLITF